MARKSSKPKFVPRAQVDPVVLKRVTDAMLDLDGQKKDLSGQRSEFAAEARQGAIHPKAHAFIVALLKLPAADRMLALECFDAYRVALKLDAWQTAADAQADIEDAARHAA